MNHFATQIILGVLAFISFAIGIGGLTDILNEEMLTDGDRGVALISNVFGFILFGVFMGSVIWNALKKT